MGARFIHVCDGCGYSAVVSGGFDQGEQACTVTIWCAACKSLSDVTVSRAEFEAQRIDPRVARRCRCGAENWRVWRSGDECPRCGRAISRVRIEMLWD